jgi:hypothetical protein
MHPGLVPLSYAAIVCSNLRKHNTETSSGKGRRKTLEVDLVYHRTGYHIAVT